MDREELIIHNQKLIYYVIKRMNLFFRVDELYDVGLIGLIKGADSYNSEKGTQSTYFYRCIKNEIMMYLRKKRPSTISLNTLITDNLTLGDTLVDDYNLEYEVEKKEKLIQIYNCINNLSPKEQDLIIKYFGLFESKKYTQQELAKIYNYSQGYITRLIKKAIEKIKKEVNSC